VLTDKEKTWNCESWPACLLKYSTPTCSVMHLTLFVQVYMILNLCMSNGWKNLFYKLRHLIQVKSLCDEVPGITTLYSSLAKGPVAHFRFS
jgi:hypothetical protein